MYILRILFKILTFLFIDKEDDNKKDSDWLRA